MNTTTAHNLVEVQHGYSIRTGDAYVAVCSCTWRSMWEGIETAARDRFNEHTAWVTFIATANPEGN